LHIKILLRAHYLPEWDNAERWRILAQKINFEGEGLEKRAFDINQSRIVMNENITGGPGGKLDEIESAKLLEMAYWDWSMLKKLQEFPAIGKLLASFWEQWSDIWKALSNVHIDDALMQNFSVISWDLILVFTEAEISRINTFLWSHWKKLPEGIDIEDLKEVGDTNLDGETLTLLINTLRDIKLNKTDGIEAVAAKSNDIAETISVTKKLEWFDKIEVTHPEIFSVYQAIQEGENFGGLLTKIDFKAEWVLDALDYMVDNCRWLITESQLASIARFTKKSPDELRANLEFTDWEAGVTIEFMRNIFRVQQEVTTKRKIIDNPFEMEMTDLARLIKRIFLDKWPEISQYIQNTSELLESIKVLKKANFGDPEFIVNYIPRLSDFYDVFW